MAKKKKMRGHYCKICDTIMANERFSGKGHTIHICKKCSKLSVEERNEQQTINRIYSLFRFAYLSKANRAMLIKYCNYKSEKVRTVAKEVLDDFNTAAMEWKSARELEEQMELEYFDEGNTDDVYEEDFVTHEDWIDEVAYDEDDEGIPF